ncbi:MAG: DedA family protein, partial [Gammaproteobacteria bacterium]|nr:DedA family protein [Gammaproteobacteria bacterium]
MPEDMIAKLVLGLQQYPALTLLFVFLVAFAESLVIVGLIVPGAIFMILFGALIAIDALEFWPTVFFATLGAIAGDSLSYWLGKRYKTTLHRIWPLSRHPEILERADAFFIQHGVKSIALSRFIGLLRPIIPATAGMSKMPVNVFLIANISSAIFWAPLYLLPGLLFGLSLEIASEFASKFIFLIVILLLAIFIVLLAIQRLYIFSKPYTDKIILYLTGWGTHHPLLGEIPAALFNKNHSELKGLSLVALLVFIATGLLTLINSPFAYSFIPFSYNFDSLDQFIYFSLQTFRTPPLDNIMLWLSFLSSSEFFALLYLAVGILFLKKNNLYLLWYWLAAISLPLILTPMLNSRLADSLQQNLNFDSNTLPLIIIISVVGFLTIIINSGLSYSRQKFIFYFSSTLVLFLIL